MIAHRSAVDPWLLPLFAAAGLAFGCGYFIALRRAVAALAASGALRRSLGWLLARLAAAALFFAWVAHRGAWPLAAAFLGFLAARQIATGVVRRAA